MTVTKENNELNYTPTFAQEPFYQELYRRRVYRYDAISGAQIAVYIGSRNLIDDATAIQFSLSQSKKPIYGYHSMYFDAVADGVVIVHGRLFINFIHQGYLRLLIKNARDPNFLEKEPSESSRAKEEAKSGKTTYDGVPGSQEALVRFIKEENQRKQTDSIEKSTGMRRPDILGETAEIRIKYASDQQFDNVPVKLLKKVHFIGEGQEIQISGQPIQEMYEFIAQKVN